MLKHTLRKVLPKGGTPQRLTRTPAEAQQKDGQKLQRNVGKHATKVKDVPDLGGLTPDQRARNNVRRSKMQSNAPEQNGLHNHEEKV